MTNARRFPARPGCCQSRVAVRQSNSKLTSSSTNWCSSVRGNGGVRAGDIAKSRDKAEMRAVRSLASRGVAAAPKVTKPLQVQLHYYRTSIVYLTFQSRHHQPFTTSFGGANFAEVTAPQGTEKLVLLDTLPLLLPGLVLRGVNPPSSLSASPSSASAYDRREGVRSSKSSLPPLLLVAERKEPDPIEGGGAREPE